MSNNKLCVSHTVHKQEVEVCDKCGSKMRLHGSKLVKGKYEIDLDDDMGVHAPIYITRYYTKKRYKLPPHELSKKLRALYQSDATYEIKIRNRGGVGHVYMYLKSLQGRKR